MDVQVTQDELIMMIGMREVQIRGLRKANTLQQQQIADLTLDVKERDEELVIVRGKVAELERQITQDYGEPMSDGVAGE